MTANTLTQKSNFDISLIEIDQAMSTIGVQPDLGMQVVVQIAPGFIKLKNIALICMNKDINEAAKYEIRRLINSHIPSIINSFTSLPIEYRNNKIIKDEKPARSIFLQDLQKILQTIDDLEQKVLSNEEKEFLVSHNFFNATNSANNNANSFNGAMDILNTQGSNSSGPHAIESNFDYQKWVSEGGKDYIVANTSANKETAAEQKKAQNAIFTAQRMLALGHIAKKSTNTALKSAARVAEFLKLTAKNIFITIQHKYDSNSAQFQDRAWLAVFILTFFTLISTTAYILSPTPKDRDFQEVSTALAYVSQVVANSEKMSREKQEKTASDFIEQTKKVRSLGSIKTSVAEDKLVFSISGVDKNNCSKIANIAMDYFSFQDTKTGINVNQQEYESKKITDLQDYRPYVGLNYQVSANRDKISENLRAWRAALDQGQTSIQGLQDLNIILPKNFKGQEHAIGVACGLDKNSLVIEVLVGQKPTPTREIPTAVSTSGGASGGKLK